MPEWRNHWLPTPMWLGCSKDPSRTRSLTNSMKAAVPAWPLGIHGRTTRLRRQSASAKAKGWRGIIRSLTGRDEPRASSREINVQKQEGAMGGAAGKRGKKSEHRV